MLHSIFKFYRGEGNLPYYSKGSRVISTMEAQSCVLCKAQRYRRLTIIVDDPTPEGRVSGLLPITHYERGSFSGWGGGSERCAHRLTV